MATSGARVPAAAIRGVARVDRRTKHLVHRLRPREIAVICHRDLDETAARALVRAGALAVVNADVSLSGRYPNPGPRILLEAGIPLLDVAEPGLLERIRDGAVVELEGSSLLVDGEPVAQGHLWTMAEVQERMAEARQNLNRELEEFLRNTLEYALREKGLVSEGLPLPPLRTSFAGRHVLVVVRGRDYRQDLLTVKAYIQERRPVLVGVDGGADALLEFGLTPHVIVGDMDSVSDQALRCGAELVVHAYPNGEAPGLARLQALGLQGHVLPAPGTSEDVALLLAFEAGAELIVAVGTHSGVVDFLEKGRRGMASTLLTRMKVGSILVDAKGVSQLYQGGVRVGQLIPLVLAGLLTTVIVFLSAPVTRNLLRLLIMRLRVAMGL